MVEFIIRRQFTPAWTKIFGGGGEARKKTGSGGATKPI